MKPKFMSLAGAALVGLVLSSAFAEIRVAFDGVTIPVAVPDAADARPVQKTAVDELCTYLGKVTGLTFRTVPESEVAGKAIYLGATKFAVKHGIDLSSFDKEEWLVREVDGNLVLAGGEPRGTLYAVYHFLEDVVGVHWFAPRPDGEYVPSRAELVVDRIDLRGKPAFVYREIYTVPEDEGTRYLARNRMNTYSVAYGGGNPYGGAANSHTLYENLGTADEVKTLYREHPEYFPFKDGRRYCDERNFRGGSQSQLCLTNPDLRALWAAKLRERILKTREQRRAKGASEPLYYAVDQNDCFDGFCKCERCQAIVEREGSNAGLMLDFANDIAARVEDVLGESKIQMMALHSSERPPKTLRAGKNVTIRLCDTTSNLLKPWTDPENAKHLDNLREWTKHADRIEMWDYSVTYGSPDSVHFPTPAEFTFATDLKTLLANKGDGVFFEHEYPVAADMRDLKTWVEFKLAEDPNLDGDALIRTFCRLYYGEAAGAKVLEYRRWLLDIALKANVRITWYPGLVSYEFLDAAAMAEAYRLYGEAAAAASDAKMRQRVDHAFASLNRLYIIRASALRREVEEKKLDVRLPNVEKVAARYRQTLEAESEARGYGRDSKELKNALDRFFKLVEARRDLPIPEVLREYDRKDVFMFSATLLQRYFDPNRIVNDSTAVPGMAMRISIADVKKQLKYNLAAYDYPFKWVIWPTTKGTVRGTVINPPKAKPEGYHWYKCAEDVEPLQDTRFALFSGNNLLLRGVVRDNSEIGQKYDVWASIKVEGPDYFESGKVTDENVISIDQFAVVRKTQHGK